MFFSTTEEEEITKRVKQGVLKMGGCYRPYTSDTFLSAVLVREIDSVANNNPNIKFDWGKIAYDAGVNIFEKILEGICEAPGNGHHKSQKFAEHFVDLEMVPSYRKRILDPIAD